MVIFIWYAIFVAAWGFVWQKGSVIDSSSILLCPTLLQASPQGMVLINSKVLFF